MPFTAMCLPCGQTDLKSVERLVWMLPCYLFRRLEYVRLDSFLSYGLVAQWVEQWLIKFGGRGVDFPRGRRFFDLPLHVVCLFLTRANTQ